MRGFPLGEGGASVRASLVLLLRYMLVFVTFMLTSLTVVQPRLSAGSCICYYHVFESTRRFLERWGALYSKRIHMSRLSSNEFFPTNVPNNF
jgi:hypothetical protein